MPSIEIFDNLQFKLLSKLEQGLAKDLYYHNIRHTIDVIEQSERIALGEGIDEDDIFLLKIAALYHDSGFLFTYVGHEVAGCDLAKKELSMGGFTTEQIDIVCGIIMATRIPQSPITKMEEIICDADLDYLGRADFFTIGKDLFAELVARKMATTEEEWNQRQVSFFKQHHYFTATNSKSREEGKLKHLNLIEAML